MFPFRELYSLLVFVWTRMRVADYVHRLQRETNLCSMLVFADVKVCNKLLEHIHSCIKEKKYTI